MTPDGQGGSRFRDRLLRTKGEIGIMACGGKAACSTSQHELTTDPGQGRFFTLCFPGRQGTRRLFYEADRGTTWSNRTSSDSTTSQWAQNLRVGAARHPIVSPNPSPLFWFTTSELITKPVDVNGRMVPNLTWSSRKSSSNGFGANPTEEKCFNLAD